jgi:hypothetical protein
LSPILRLFDLRGRKQSCLTRTKTQEHRSGASEEAGKRGEGEKKQEDRKLEDENRVRRRRRRRRGNVSE